MARSTLVAILGLLAACDRTTEATSRLVPGPTDTPPTALTPPATVTPPGTVTAVFAGGRRSCAMRDGALRCWGDASRGSLGAGVVMSTTTVPTAIPGLEGATSVALGESHGCAILADATVRCWGSNEYGALGNAGSSGDSPAPLAVPGLTGVTALVAHGRQTCALTPKDVQCWGDPNGKFPGSISGLGPLGGLGGLHVDSGPILQLALGQRHGCARTGREVLCWGDNDHGQLGQTDPTRREVALPVPSLGAVDEVAAAGNYSCARTGGKVSCWGDGEHAQLGQTARKDGRAPQPITGLDDAVALALGPDHACALQASGTVACWGGSDRGAFGYPQQCPQDRAGQSLSPGTSGVMMVYCAAPLPVPGITDAVALVHGLGHACALTRAGALRCWGGDNYGELGNREHGAGGSKTPIEVSFPEPQAATPTTRAIAVAANGEWSCAALADHTVRCWGSSALGQLGPDIKTLSARPVTIAGLHGVDELALGAYHGCALVEDGGVRCWGYNGNANLGDGSIETRSAPVTPIGLPPVTQISASGDPVAAHTCAVAKDGAVWCWGDNHTGQALPGGPSPTPPVAVPGITAATQVVAGHGGTCVLAQGNVQCWGVLPIAGGRAMVVKPTAVSGLDHVVEIGMGYQVFCGRRDDDSVWCWGQQNSGLVPPTAVPLGGQVRAIALGSYGAAALRADGKPISWWVEQPSGPTEIPIPDVTRLATSGSHTCALDKDGRVLCWGWNMNGQLGNPDQGAGGESPVPNQVRL